MKKTILSLAVATVLALGACGSNGSEPAKTVTETAASQADERAAGDAEGYPEGVSAEDFDLPTFDSPEDMATQAPFEGQWESEYGDGPCAPEETESSSLRDPESGDVVDYDLLRCWSSEVPGEFVDFAVFAEDAPELVEMAFCEEFLVEECFAAADGEGWAVYASGGSGHQADVLEGLGVDPEVWGVGEGMGDEGY